MAIDVSKDVEYSIRFAMYLGQFASVEDALSEALRLLFQELNQRPSPSILGSPSSESADPILGLMRDDVELMDEIVDEAYRLRWAEPWRDVDL